MLPAIILSKIMFSQTLLQLFQNNKIKRVEQHMKDLFTQVGPKITYTYKREISQTPLSMSSLQKEIQKSYKQLTSISSPRAILISTFFSFQSLPMTKRLNDFTTQDVSKLFPNFRI